MNIPELTAVQERALEFCNYCPRLCHFACPAGHGDASETATAWGMMSLANMIRKGELEPSAEDAKNLYRCASCSRCTEFCRHDIPVAEVLQVFRGAMDERGLTPPELEELRAGPSFRIDTRGRGSEVLFIPGCEAKGAASKPEHDTALLALIDAAAGGAVHVGAPGMCCGAGAREAGFKASAGAHDDALRAASAGYALVVSECGAARVAGETVAVSTLEFLAQHIAELTPAKNAAPIEVTLHGGCRARRPNDRSAPEKALLAAVGVTALDAFAIAGSQECCGGDAVYSRVSPEGAARAARAVVEGARMASDTEGERLLVTSSAGCAAHMTRSSGERVVSVLELVAERCR